MKQILQCAVTLRTALGAAAAGLVLSACGSTQMNIVDVQTSTAKTLGLASSDEITIANVQYGKKNGLGGRQGHLGVEGNAIAVANLKCSGSFLDGDDLVAGGKYGDAGFYGAKQFRGADLGGQSKLGIAESRAWREDGLAGRGLAAARHDVLGALRGALEGDRVPFAERVFEHDNRVGARRNGGAGHDLHASRRC